MAKKTGDPLGAANAASGVCYESKREHVPMYNARDGDYVITGTTGAGGRNNNAWIVLGRDREDDACSGYGGVGNSKVGKTSITHRVVFDQFEE